MGDELRIFEHAPDDGDAAIAARQFGRRLRNLVLLVLVLVRLRVRLWRLLLLRMLL